MDSFNLSSHGVTVQDVHRNLAPARLYMEAIRSGEAAAARTVPNPVFGVGVVAECPGVPREVLIARDAWADKASYDATARKLAGLFRDNFRQYEDRVVAEVKEAGPRV